MAKVVFANTDNLDTGRNESVELHGAGCNHLKRYNNNPFFEKNDPEEWDSAQDFYDDYNADFIDEDGVVGAYAVAVFPCTKLVKSTTVIDKPSYDAPFEREW